MKNSKKILIISVVPLALISIGLFWFFQISDIRWSPRTSAEKEIYQNKSVPFTFEYPKSWSLSKKNDSNNNTHIDYVIITARDKSNKKVVEIKYHTYSATTASAKQATDTDCESKRGDYLKQCSYIPNSYMEPGYFYHRAGTNYWNAKLMLYKTVNGERFFDKTVSITLTLFEDSAPSMDELINLTKSIKPATNQ